MIYPSIAQYIANLDTSKLDAERRQYLNDISSTIIKELSKTAHINLIYICTHNSRRSIFAQVMSKAISLAFGLPICSHSAGAEATYVAPQVLRALTEAGFHISSHNTEKDSVHFVRFSDSYMPMAIFSKEMEHPANPNINIITMATCSQAQESCPVFLTEKHRFALTFEDPKSADGTPLEKQTYRDTLEEISTNLLYLLSKIKAVY